MHKTGFFKLAAVLVAAALSGFAQADTSITIDAKQNCLSNAWGTTSGGSTANFQLPPGRYIATLVSNNMSCSYGMLGGCNIDTVMVQGGFGNARWGLAVNANPTVIEVTSEYLGFVAYVSDNICSDNTGSAKLLLQSAS